MQLEKTHSKLGQWRQVMILMRSLGWRSLKQKTYVLLAFCLFFSAFIASGLAYFSAGVQQALNDDIAQFLGAPLVIRSDRELPDQWWSAATINPPVQTISVTHGATGSAGYHSIALKGVSDSYPMQDDIKLLNQSGELTATGQSLNNHQAWLDARAMSVLGVGLGEQIYIGNVSFTVVAEILFEPDRLTQLQHVLPRVMVHLDDMRSIGLAFNNGRSEFRYLFNAAEPVLSAFESSLSKILPMEHQVLKPDAGGHPFSRMAQRADKLLGMVLVLVLLLCGASAALLATFAVEKYVMPASMLRCMGLKRSVFSHALLMQLVLLALFSGSVGSLLGWLIQPWLKSLLEPHLMLAEVGFSGLIALTAIGVSLLTLLAFVYPRLRALSSVPVSQVLRGLQTVSHAQLVSLVSGLFCVVLLLWYYSDNWRLTTYLVIGVVSMVAMALLFGWLLNKATGLLHHFNKGIVRVSLRSIGRNPRKHMITMSTIALAVMSLLMTTNLRGSFLDRYHVQRISHDGNYIFSGLPEEQRPEFTHFMQQNQIEIKGMHPTVSAKLFSINGLLIDQALSAESDTREETRSPVRLSWAEQLPANNLLNEGQWPSLGGGEVSVEAEVMSDLGLKIGDVLGFKINDEILSARIISSRSFKSGGSMMMFWFMFAPDALADFKQHYMGGLEVSKGKQALIKSMAAQFPAILVTDIEQQVFRMRAIMTGLTKMMNSILILLVAAALTVLMASAFISMHTQHKQINLMRALGVLKHRLYWMLLIEQAVVGLVACLIGVLGAQLIAGLMFNQQFGVSYEPNWGELSVLILTVTSVFACIGLLMAYFRIKQPIQLFQQL